MLRKSQNSCGNPSIQPVPTRHSRQEPDTSGPPVSPRHPALCVAQTPHPPTRPRGAGGRQGTRCVKPSGDAAPGTGRLRQQGGSLARFQTPEPPDPSTSSLRPAAAKAASPTPCSPQTGPTAPAQPARRHHGRGLGSGSRRRRALGRPQGCRARGRAPLTAAGHQHQELGCLHRTSEGTGATAAAPALPASGGGPEVAPEGAADPTSGRGTRRGSCSRRGRLRLVRPGAGLEPTTAAWVFAVSRGP